MCGTRCVSMLAYSGMCVSRGPAQFATFEISSYVGALPSRSTATNPEFADVHQSRDPTLYTPAKLTTRTAFDQDTFSS
jgi:hypothetical protein